MRDNGAESLAVVADANNVIDCERMVAETLDRFGRLDIIINAVGGGAGTALFAAEQYPASEWERIKAVRNAGYLFVNRPEKG